MSRFRWLAAVLLISVWPFGAAADSASESLEALLSELGALIDEGERTRAADPRFQRSYVKLDDGADHELVWTRARDGLMIVSIDGEEALRNGDLTFRDPFDGISLVNHGGRYVLRSIVITGSR